VVTGETSSGPALAVVDPGGQVSANAFLEVTIRVRLGVDGVGGVFFDAYASDDYKYVLLDVAAQTVAIGNVAPGRPAVVASSVAMRLVTDTWIDIVITIKGASVSAQVNGAFAGSWGFNSAVADGRFGVLAADGPIDVDRVRIRTDGLVASTEQSETPDDPDPLPSQPEPPPSEPEPTPAPDPVVSFAAGTVTVDEGDAGQTWLELELVLSEPTDHDVVVWVAVTGGAASAGDDYEMVMVAVVIPAGATTATIPLAITGDTSREADETFTVAITESEGASVGSQDATTVTIVDDDAKGRRK
jgi:hypothetical protein